MIQPVVPHGLSGELLHRIEEAAMEQAREVLTARRFLEFEGPLGAGVPSLQVGDLIEESVDDEGTLIAARRALPIPTLHATFRLPTRELQGAQEHGFPLSTGPAEDAAERVALAEERLIYHGHADLGIGGLLNTSGAQRTALSDWSNPGAAIGDVIAAADKLDAAGVHAPFALVLAPTLYNQLFRKYEGSDVLALDHLRRLAAGGIYKSHVLRDTAALVSPDVGPLVCAQDLQVSFLDMAADTVRFLVSSSVVLRLDDAAAVCVLARK
ncbi:MAG: family 1 encapsulin nanocompartment shell protein [Myxococcota bacterium]